MASRLSTSGSSAPTFPTERRSSPPMTACAPLVSRRRGRSAPSAPSRRRSSAPRPSPMAYADLVERLHPAVVNISTMQRIPVRAQSDPFEKFFRRLDPTLPPSGGGGNGNGAQPRTREAGSLGSGFLISPDGYIVTNN